MEQDKLKEFIQSNRSDFDRFQPSDQCWERINEALEDSDIHRWKKWRAIAIAASIAVVVSAGFIIGDILSTDSGMAVTPSEVEAQIAEMDEIGHYYAVQVNERFAELSNYDVDPEFMQAIEELKVEFSELEHEMAIGANPERILQAMVENYRLRLELLEDLLEAVKKEHSKSTQHEEDLV